MTAALLDRLTHKAHILEFVGESYRFRQRLAQAAQTAQMGEQRQLYQPQPQPQPQSGAEQQATPEEQEEQVENEE